MEKNVTTRCWTIILILALSVALPGKAGAQTGSSRIESNGAIFGGIAAAAAAVAVVAYLIIHQSAKKRGITGCVTSAGGGMTLTDEKDKRKYLISGNTTSVKPGDRMTLRGSKGSADHGKTLVWKTNAVVKDFGVCQP
jgi:hypothetical protein